MSQFGLLAVAAGAVLGAYLRWGLGTALNPVFAALPLGTLAANLLGAYLIGVAIACFSQHASLPPEFRLLVITGFLGSFTTFSTFSAEVVGLLLRAQYLWAAGVASIHLFGSLAMTALGLYTFDFSPGFEGSSR